MHLHEPRRRAADRLQPGGGAGRDCPLHDIIHHTHPDGRPFPLAKCAIDRAFPENNQEKGEEVFVHKDGSFYPVAFTASPIRDDAAQIIGTIIEVRDITEERAAAERQRLLTDGLNHRVKNTLATVQAIAAQSFRATDQAALTMFNARMIALSNAHNLLTEDSWQSASLSDVIERALAPHLLAEVDASRFQLSGPDARVHPKVAVTFAMALHELMTNAAKCGALSVPTGWVNVNWLLRQDEAETHAMALARLAAIRQSMFWPPCRLLNGPSCTTQDQLLNEVLVSGHSAGLLWIRILTLASSAMRPTT